jgi:molybdopterin-containing oxidoreductase family membrane subunit
VLTSSFYDGVIAQYSPSIWEILLGLGGTALAFMIVALAVKVLRFLPASLSDDMVAPEASMAAAPDESALRATG